MCPPHRKAPSLTAEAVARAAIQIARPLGEDPATDPIIDARLADGSRVAVCSPPAASATAITIRRFGGRAFTIEELTASGSLPAPVVEATAAVLQAERNVLISGGPGSGKTTLLNALVALLPAEGRVISIEDTLELRLRRANCLRFEARGLAGRGVTIRDLVRHALRHRPDHIVVGEVRGAEAADLLQALNMGHGGSLATVHTNNAEAALSRLATWPCRRATRCPGRWSTGAWSTASRPSFTKRGSRARWRSCARGSARRASTASARPTGWCCPSGASSRRRTPTRTRGCTSWATPPGHPSRLNRPTLVEHGGFGTETCAREELRAEIAAMMTGEQLGVDHEPRHGTAYVSSWIKALENDPRENRAAAVDAQRIWDRLLSRERERSLGRREG